MIKNSKPSSELLEFLKAFWDTRSLPLASDRVGIGVATGFRLLKKGREIFEDVLFVKSGRIMVPTPKMEALIPEIKEILRKLESLTEEKVFRPEEAKGPIRIGCVDNALLGFVLPTLKEIFKQAPNLHLSFYSLREYFQTDLAKGKLDLVFYAPPNFKPQEGIRYREMFRTFHVYVVRKGHPLEKLLKKKGDLTSEDLKPYRFLALRYGIPEAALVENFTGYQEEVDFGIDMPFFLASPFVLEETDLIVRLPYFSANRLKKHFPLVFLPSNLIEETPWHALMIWHERTEHDPTLQWLRALLASASAGKVFSK